MKIFDTMQMIMNQQKHKVENKNIIECQIYERQIYTFEHSVNFLKKASLYSCSTNQNNDQINKIAINQIQIPELSIKQGYSVTELFKAILTHSDIPSSFYTFFFVRGRRILSPNTFIHKYVLQYSLEDSISLISNARMRIYHLFKYDHEGKSKIKIQQGFMKFAPLSKANKTQLINSIDRGLENIFSPLVLQHITLSGGQLFPYHSLSIHNFFSLRQSELV